jgi:uncharacterized repeat protein (TIGR03803 family)
MARPGDEGSNPVAGLTEASNGIIYGVTVLGGPGQGGVVFRITPD